MSEDPMVSLVVFIFLLGKGVEVTRGLLDRSLKA